MNKVVKMAAILSVLTASQYATSSTLDCSDAKGKTKYSEWNYDGGAQPTQGMVVAKSSIVLKNKVLDETTTRVGVYSEPEAKFTYNYEDRVELAVIEKEDENIRIEYFGVIAIIEKLTDSGYEAVSVKYAICKSKSDLFLAP